MPDLKPLNNQIFAENLDRMKNVAKTYYTIERLPENINDYLINSFSYDLALGYLKYGLIGWFSIRIIFLIFVLLLFE